MMRLPTVKLPEDRRSYPLLNPGIYEGVIVSREPFPSKVRPERIYQYYKARLDNGRVISWIHPFVELDPGTSVTAHIRWQCYKGETYLLTRCYVGRQLADGSWV